MTLEIDKVSVLLPVYNGAEHLEIALVSVLSQSYSNLELIIVDDASIDDSWKIISSISDPRVLSVRNDANLGLSRSLNIASRLATGEFLARHDQDDVSHPDRLRRQVEYFQIRPRVVAIGTWVQLRHYSGMGFRDSLPPYQHPTSDSSIRLLLTWNTPFVHGSIMMRRSAFESCGGYSEDLHITPPEDYELWTRLCSFGDFANIPVPLLTYQVNPNGMSQTRSDEIFKKSMIVSERVIKQQLPGTFLPSLEKSLTILHGRPNANLRGRDFIRTDYLVYSLAKAISRQQGSFPLGQVLRTLRVVHLTQLGNSLRKVSWIYRIAKHLLGTFNKQ